VIFEDIGGKNKEWGIQMQDFSSFFILLTLNFKSPNLAKKTKKNVCCSANKNRF